MPTHLRPLSAGEAPTSSRSRQTRRGLSPEGVPPPATIPGVPLKVSAALDALDEPDLTALKVGSALDQCLRAVSRSRAKLTREQSDWTEFIIPMERDVLERGMDAVDVHHS